MICVSLTCCNSNMNTGEGHDRAEYWWIREERKPHVREKTKQKKKVDGWLGEID